MNRKERERAARRGAAGFDAYYRGLFSERWAPLHEALLAPPEQIPYSRGLLRPYFLDRASLLAAESLEVGDGHRVLDLCAAPGGKSLVLAGAMGGRGTLTVNERSSARRARLVRVLDEHLPEEVRNRIDVTGHDAARWGLHEQNAYDRVLLDVPCSSERHLLHSPPHLDAWSPARTKHLAVQAYAMLASGFEALVPGGMLLYSTCALSPLENDRVVEKLLRKKGDRCETLALRLPEGEETEHGLQIWPDRSGGIGPIYCARIGKRE